MSNVKQWILAKKCVFLGHSVEYGSKCPVTGIVKITCLKCGASNVPKHEDAGSRFN
jgi:uncharacterized protein (DUF2237 family)